MLFYVSAWNRLLAWRKCSLCKNFRGVEQGMGKDGSEATRVLQRVPRGSLGTGLLLMHIAYQGGSVSLIRPAFQKQQIIIAKAHSGLLICSPGLLWRQSFLCSLDTLKWGARPRKFPALATDFANACPTCLAPAAPVFLPLECLLFLNSFSSFSLSNREPQQVKEDLPPQRKKRVY